MLQYVQILILMTTLPFLSLSQSAGINHEFKKTIDSYLSGKVDYMTIEELKQILDKPEEVIILDTREIEEFNVSHIPGALFMGYKNWNKNLLNEIDHNKKVVLYCSIGYRSEKIGKKLKSAGFKHVYNLYGSIFAWVNAGYEVFDNQGAPTPFVHGYNRSWSKWISNPGVQKVW